MAAPVRGFSLAVDSGAECAVIPQSKDVSASGGAPLESSREKAFSPAAQSPTFHSAGLSGNLSEPP